MIVITTSIIGSRIVGLIDLQASLKASDAAILNEISLESTGWYDPSYSTALTPITGNPAIGPCSSVSIRPFSTAGKKFLGTEPPTTSDANSKSLSANGSKRIQTSPNWPAPPDCFL